MFFNLYTILIISAKLIGAGLATISIASAGIGISTIFGSYLITLSKNPQLKNDLFNTIMLGFALYEATTLFCLLIAFLILFAF